MKNSNPFLPSEKYNPKFFCNRDEEITAILKELSEDRNIFIHSNKGVGKTKLINHLFFILSQSANYYTVYFGIEPPCTFNEFVAGFVTKIIDDLPKKLKKSILKEMILDESSKRELYKKLSGDEPENLLIKTFSALQKLDKKVIIALDNCHLCAHFGREKVELMLLEPLTSYKNVSLILSGRKKVLLPQNCKQIFMDNINQAVYSKFIKDVFKMNGRPVTNKALRKLMIWSKGNTEITQLVCSRLWYVKKNKIRLKDLEEAIDCLMKEVKIYYYHISSLISPYQLKLLRSIALQDKPFQVTSSAFIKQYRLNAPSSVKTALHALSEKNLIYRQGNSYFLKDILLNNWFNYKNSCI